MNYLSPFLLTQSLTYLLTPHCTVLIEKLTVFQLVKEFPAFYGTRKFNTAFTSPSHLSLSRASSIQSIPPQSTFSRITLIFSSHLCLCLPSGRFQISPSKPCIRLSSPPYALHALPILFLSISIT